MSGSVAAYFERACNIPCEFCDADALLGLLSGENAYSDPDDPTAAARGTNCGE